MGAVVGRGPCWGWAGRDREPVLENIFIVSRCIPLSCISRLPAPRARVRDENKPDTGICRNYSVQLQRLLASLYLKYLYSTLLHSPTHTLHTTFIASFYSVFSRE